jgi:hypothetical protein
MKKKTHKQILAELMKKNIIPPEVRENSRDIEEIIVERGGEGGSLRHA